MVFLHNPLYNCLQQRKTKVSAKVTCLLTKEEIKEKMAEFSKYRKDPNQDYKSNNKDIEIISATKKVWSV